MRKKTLAAFAAVYSVICLGYGTVNGINMPVSSETAEEISAEESTSAEARTMTVTTVLEPLTEQPAEETTVQSRKHKGKTAASAEVPEESTKAQTETETTTQAPEEIFTQPPETTVTEAPQTFIETSPDTEYTEEYAQQIEDIPEPEIPSLDEYLRGLRCSGCRHNCSLANPRCMNGARKASQAQSEYYSIYG